MSTQAPDSDNAIPESLTTALPAPAAATGYIRAAVVQVAFHPAALVEEGSPLEDPVFSAGREASLDLPMTDEGFQLEGACAELRRKVREAYCMQLRAKLLGILRQCVEWSVDIVVLPEYSTPPELLGDLLQFSKTMCIVAGTHAVEAQAVGNGLYAAIGMSTPPVVGEAVAPVLFDGVAVALQTKLNRAGPEVNLVPGTSWDPIPLSCLGGRNLGVLVCLDFLKRESVEHHALVSQRLDECCVLAVPSLTPHYTVHEFAAKAYEEAKRYGRPVLYADWAKGGGTTVRVDSAGDSGRPFPSGIGLLEQNEEGVVIVDLDLANTRPTEKGATRYETKRTVMPVCAASLVYRSQIDGDAYASWVDQFAASVGQEDILKIAEYVRTHRATLVEFAKVAPPARKSRLYGLLARLDSLVKPEEVFRYLREVALGDEILALPEVREQLADCATDEVRTWLTRSNSVMVSAIIERLQDFK